MSELSLFPADLSPRPRLVNPIVEDIRLAGWRSAVKDCVDPVLAVVAALVLAPILLYLAALVRLSGKGPVLVHQVRVGRGGKPFSLVKLRTFVWSAGSDADPEDEIEPLLQATDDGLLAVLPPRVRLTKVGRGMRLTGLDELPQLFNIIAGRMSFVGPRPRPPQQAADLHYEALPLLLAKPGLAGLRQVAGIPAGTDRDVLDLHGVRSWSFGLDVAILVRAAQRLVAGTRGLRDPFLRD